MVGLNLGLRDSTLERIALDNSDKIDKCKREMISVWLKLVAYEYLTFKTCMW